MVFILCVLDITHHAIIAPRFTFQIFMILVYDFSVLSYDFVFVNDCDFSNLFFHYFVQAIVI